MLHLRTVPPPSRQKLSCLTSQKERGDLLFPHEGPGTGTWSLPGSCCCHCSAWTSESSWTSFSYHLPEASKELKLWLQGLICSQALSPGTSTLCFPQHSPLRAALGSGGHTSVQSSITEQGAPGQHAIHTGLLSWLSAVSCVLGSSQPFSPFLNLSIHQPDDTLKTEVSWKSCSPLWPGNE